MKFEAHIEGLDDLKSTISNMIKSLAPDEVEPVVFDGAEMITREVRARITRVGRKTGNLYRGAVTRQLPRRGTWPSPALSKMDWNVAPHSYWVEYGTKKRRPVEKQAMYDAETGTFYGKEVKGMKAQPFFNPAVIAKGEPALQHVANELGRKVERAMQK